MLSEWKIRRWLVLGAMSTALGVATTYAIAWAFMNAPPNSPRTTGTFIAELTAVSTHGWVVSSDSRIGVMELVLGASDVNHNSRDAVFDWPGPALPGYVPSWSLAHRVSPKELYPGWQSTKPTLCMFWERAAGWPRLAVVEREVATPPGMSPTRQYGASVRVGGNGVWSGMVLAFTPIWSGFAADAALYVVVWAAVLWGARVMRRWMRARKGHCPQCRYDLTGLTGGVCPECGSPAPVGRADFIGR